MPTCWWYIYIVRIGKASWITWSFISNFLFWNSCVGQLMKPIATKSLSMKNKRKAEPRTAHWQWHVRKKQQPEYDTSLLRLSSLQSLSLVSLWTQHLPRARLQVVKSKIYRHVTAFPTFRIDPLFWRTSLTKSWWGSPWKMIMSRTTAKKCKIYISTTITTIKVPLEMEETPPHKLLTLSTMFTLLHSLHLYSLSVQGAKEVKGVQGPRRLRYLWSSRGGVKCFDGVQGVKGDQRAQEWGGPNGSAVQGVRWLEGS